ncbi:cell division protein FtsL [Adlercreutzia sp. ZJ473]|uniref:cell division protein FtsL n=1 Tax=Adlercreutzia sp. ZJ473 TaxID=2722822 RepID=UPI0015565B34|nr:cell division protein FtsL [Adlercreutzia sp. ZJ473]
MSAAPAYDFQARALERERHARPDISVVPGRGRSVQSEPRSSSVAVLAKVAVAALLAFALLSVARIALSSATVATAIESQQLSAQIEEARVAGSQLEVAQSTLSNPTAVKGAAAALGMAPAAETVKVNLPADVVVTDEAGALSLSGSVAAVAGM